MIKKAATAGVRTPSSTPRPCVIEYHPPRWLHERSWAPAMNQGSKLASFMYKTKIINRFKMFSFVNCHQSRSTNARSEKGYHRSGLTQEINCKDDVLPSRDHTCLTGGVQTAEFFDEDHRRHFSLCKHTVKMDCAEIRWMFPKVRAQPWESAEYRGK